MTVGQRSFDFTSTTAPDSEAPTLTINDLTTFDTTPTLTGTCEDADTLTLEVDGVTYNPTPSNGSWSQTLNTLTPGSYTPTLDGEDEAGNTATTAQSSLVVNEVTTEGPPVTVDGSVEKASLLPEVSTSRRHGAVFIGGGGGNGVGLLTQVKRVRAQDLMVNDRVKAFRVPAKGRIVKAWAITTEAFVFDEYPELSLVIRKPSDIDAVGGFGADTPVWEPISVGARQVEETAQTVEVEAEVGLADYTQGEALIYFQYILTE